MSATDINFTQYSVQELRDAIIMSGAMSADDVQNLKGKTNLAKFIIDNEIQMESNVSDVFEEAVLESAEIEEGEDEPREEVNIPSYNSPEWSDYVLSQFAAGEVDSNGHPLLNGLRRLTETLLGEVVSTGPYDMSYGFVEGKAYASCTYELKIAWARDISPFLLAGEGDIPVKTIRAAADSCDDNTDFPFSKYASAIAEARAEARAHRKALKLNVVAKDELCNKLDNSKGRESITTNQTKVLEVKCKGLGIDVEKFAQHFAGKQLSRCSKEDGANLISEMNNVQQNKVSEEVLEGIR